MLEAVKWVPWTVFCTGMFVTFITIYVKTESFRKAMLCALIVGKAFAVVYWIAGLDHTVLTIYVINRKAPWVVHEVRITACETLILSFLLTTLTIILYPTITKHAPKQIKQTLNQLQT